VVVFQSAAETSSRLAWFDRGGKELSEVGEVGYRDPALSRDGRLLAVSSDDDRNGKHYIRVYDFTRGTSSRISDTGNELFPVLSPDGTTVAYGTGDEKGSYLGARAADGSGTPRRLAAGRNVIPNDWSRDGRYILYMNFQNGPPSLDVYDVAAKSSRMTGHIGAEAQFSPDGKWISYIGASPSGGIFIEPFSGHGGRVQVANDGSQPRWRPDGKEIFFISLDKKLMAVSVDASGGKLVVGVPHALFQTRIVSARFVLFQYAVAPDGQRFLINSLPVHGAAPLTVLMNPGFVSQP
jgi:Tol biopolymer transport system component